MHPDVKIYINFVCNMVCPVDSSGTDQYLRNNLSTIKKVSQALLKRIDYTPQKIYRGVVLKEQITALEPHPNFTYLSFSESKNIAYNFADVSETGFPSVFHLGEHGYIAEYTPDPKEILFHYKMLDILPVLEILASAGMESDTLPEQREVTILQPREPFTIVEPFRKYEGYQACKLFHDEL